MASFLPGPIMRQERDLAAYNAPNGGSLGDLGWNEVGTAGMRMDLSLQENQRRINILRQIMVQSVEWMRDTGGVPKYLLPNMASFDKEVKIAESWMQGHRKVPFDNTDIQGIALDPAAAPKAQSGAEPWLYVAEYTIDLDEARRMAVQLGTYKPSASRLALHAGQAAQQPTNPAVLHPVPFAPLLSLGKGSLKGSDWRQMHQETRAQTEQFPMPLSQREDELLYGTGLPMRPHEEQLARQVRDRERASRARKADPQRKEEARLEMAKFKRDLDKNMVELARRKPAAPAAAVAPVRPAVAKKAAASPPATRLAPPVTAAKAAAGASATAVAAMRAASTAVPVAAHIAGPPVRVGGGFQLAGQGRVPLSQRPPPPQHSSYYVPGGRAPADVQLATSTVLVTPPRPGFSAADAVRNIAPLQASNRPGLSAAVAAAAARPGFSAAAAVAPGGLFSGAAPQEQVVAPAEEEEDEEGSPVAVAAPVVVFNATAAGTNLPPKKRLARLEPEDRTVPRLQTGRSAREARADELREQRRQALMQRRADSRYADEEEEEKAEGSPMAVGGPSAVVAAAAVPAAPTLSDAEARERIRALAAEGATYVAVPAPSVAMVGRSHEIQRELVQLQQQLRGTRIILPRQSAQPQQRPPPSQALLQLLADAHQVEEPREVLVERRRALMHEGEALVALPRRNDAMERRSQDILRQLELVAEQLLWHSSNDPRQVAARAAVPVGIMRQVAAASPLGQRERDEQEVIRRQAARVFEMPNENAERAGWTQSRAEFQREQEEARLAREEEARLAAARQERLAAEEQERQERLEMERRLAAEELMRLAVEEGEQLARRTEERERQIAEQERLRRAADEQAFTERMLAQKSSGVSVSDSQPFAIPPTGLQASFFPTGALSGLGDQSFFHVPREQPPAVARLEPLASPQPGAFPTPTEAPVVRLFEPAAPFALPIGTKRAEQSASADTFTTLEPTPTLVPARATRALIRHIPTSRREIQDSQAFPENTPTEAPVIQLFQPGFFPRIVAPPEVVFRDAVIMEEPAAVIADSNPQQSVFSAPPSPQQPEPPGSVRIDPPGTVRLDAPMAQAAFDIRDYRLGPGDEGYIPPRGRVDPEDEDVLLTAEEVALFREAEAEAAAAAAAAPKTKKPRTKRAAAGTKKSHHKKKIAPAAAAAEEIVPPLRPPAAAVGTPGRFVSIGVPVEVDAARVARALVGEVVEELAAPPTPAPAAGFMPGAGGMFMPGPLFPVAFGGPRITTPQLVRAVDAQLEQEARARISDTRAAFDRAALAAAGAAVQAQAAVAAGQASALHPPRGRQPAAAIPQLGFHPASQGDCHIPSEHDLDSEKIDDALGVLGFPLERVPGIAAIQASFKLRTKLFHPDKAGGSAFALCEMKRINDARAVLLEAHAKFAAAAAAAAPAAAAAAPDVHAARPHVRASTKIPATKRSRKSPSTKKSRKSPSTKKSKSPATKRPRKSPSTKKSKSPATKRPRKSPSTKKSKSRSKGKSPKSKKSKSPSTKKGPPPCTELKKELAACLKKHSSKSPSSNKPRKSPSTKKSKSRSKGKSPAKRKSSKSKSRSKGKSPKKAKSPAKHKKKEIHAAEVKLHEPKILQQIKFPISAAKRSAPKKRAAPKKSKKTAMKKKAKKAPAKQKGSGAAKTPAGQALQAACIVGIKASNCIFKKKGRLGLTKGSKKPRLHCFKKPK